VKLVAALEDLILEWKTTLLTPVIVDNEEEYEVEEILNSK